MTDEPRAPDADRARRGPPPADAGGGERIGRRLWPWSVVFLTLGLALFYHAPTAADPDLFGHLRFGREILETRTIPRHDRYAFTSGDQEWIDHEWMSEVGFAAAYDALGNRGLLVFKLALAFGLLALLYRHAVRSGLGLVAGSVFMWPIVVLLMFGTVVARPGLFTLIFLALLLLTLDSAERGRHRLLWWIPVITAGWVNFHGGVLAGLGLCAVWVGGWWLELVWPGAPGPAPERQRLALVGLAVLVVAGLALLANPYGWRLPGFLLRTATVPRPDITEWRPTPLGSGRGLVYLGLSVCSIAALVWSRRPIRASRLLVFAAILLLPLTAVRHIPLYAVGIGVLLPVHVADALERLASGVGRIRWPSGDLRPLFTGLSFAAGGLLIGGGLPYVHCILIDPRRAPMYPVRAVEWIRESGIEADLATFFDWGEYAIWHLEPSVRVSMDGRRETVYPDSIYREYQDFQLGLGDWDAHLDEHGADMALVSKEWAFYNLLKLKPGWDLLYEDSIAALFAPRGSPKGATLLSTPIPDVSQRGIGSCAP